MSYPINYIKQLVEKIETERITAEFCLLDQKTGQFKNDHFFNHIFENCLSFLACVVVGVGIGIIAIIMNFLIFVFLLHIEF